MYTTKKAVCISGNGKIPTCASCKSFIHDGKFCTNSYKPPKNGEIALWPNTRVVKYKYMLHKRQTSTMIRASGTIFWTLLILFSGLAYSRLIGLYLVMSVFVDSPPANTKMSGIDAFVNGKSAISAFLAVYVGVLCTMGKNFTCVSCQSSMHDFIHSFHAIPSILFTMFYSLYSILSILFTLFERWGAGVETQKYVRGDIGGWGRVPFNETYAPSLSTIYDGA